MERPTTVTRKSNYDARGKPLLTFHLEQVTHLKQGLNRLEQVDCIKNRLAALKQERNCLNQDLARLELPQDDPPIMDSGPPRLSFNGQNPVDDPSSPGGSPKVARQIELLRKLRAPPFRYAWHFYHDKHSNSGNYEGRLTLMQDEIVTAKPFWEVLNSFPLERLQPKDSVHFFKRGVKPVWEDSRNVKGGSWTFRVPKTQAEQFWKEVLMMAVGEQFADVIQPGTYHPLAYPVPIIKHKNRLLTDWICDPGDDLCGLSMSVRFNNNLISVWNRDGTNSKTIDGILAVVLGNVSAEIKPREGHYYYKRHSDHVGFSEVVAKANEKVAVEGKITEAEVLGSEGDRALLRDEGMSVEELERADA